MIAEIIGGVVLAVWAGYLVSRHLSPRHPQQLEQAKAAGSNPPPYDWANETD